MFLIIFGRAVQFLLQIGMLRVVTTLLPPSEMGRMSLYLSATTIFAFLLVGPVGSFINRRIHAWEAQAQVRHYFGYFWIYLVVVAMFASLVLSIMNQIGIIGFQSSTAWLCVLVSGSLLFGTMNQTFIPLLNLLEFRGWFIGLTLATMVTGFLASAVLTLTMHRQAEYWLLGLLIGQTVIAGVAGRVFFGKLSVVSRVVHSGWPTRIQMGVLFKFAWPVSIAISLGWVQGQSYRFLMEDALGLSTLGLFVAGYGISTGLMSAFESVFTTYFQPIFYKRVSGNDRGEQEDAWASYAHAILPSLLLVGFFIIAAAPELSRLLLSSRYHGSSQFVIWGAITEMTRIAAWVFGMAAYARMNTRLLILPNAIGAIAAVVMMLLLMPLYGAVGVGLALTVAGIAFLISLYVAARAELAIKLPYRTLIQSVVVGGTLLMVAPSVRYFFGVDGLLTTLLSISVLVMAYIPAQYWILQPVLKKL